MRRLQEYQYAQLHAGEHTGIQKTPGPFETGTQQHFARQPKPREHARLGEGAEAEKMGNNAISDDFSAHSRTLKSGAEAAGS